ncbi:MAG: hypothetical protein KIT84_03615 [Labilithrix sp.]|nr:hypothetical protein [Labilithrix sp.]MCW5810071.1 hypothetical protein [Labilithrix sp.]
MNDRRILDPVLLASDVRVDEDGVPGCEGLSFRTKGEHVLVLGAPRALFLAAVGLRPVVRGALTVRGVAADEAVGYGLIAGAALDPPLPPRWTVHEYVEWSARLSGAPPAEAKSVAAGAIARLKLEPMAKTRLSMLVPHARRATVVAAALAASTEIVALEDPLGGLPEEVAASYGAVLLEALADRAWLVFAPRIALTSPFARAAEDALVLSATRVDGQGPPAELASTPAPGKTEHQALRWIARLDGALEPVREALAARGSSLEEQGAHVLLDLAAGTTTSELAAICAAADVAILELMPVSRPIARAFL